MVTLNNIMSLLETFANNHFMLSAFSHGNVDEADYKDGTAWPLMHVVYTGSEILEKTKEYSFDIYFVTVPIGDENDTDKQAYQVESISDMEQVAEDLVNDVRKGFNIFSESFNFDEDGVTLTPIEEEGGNTFSGVLMSISFEVPYLNDSCALPLSSYTPTVEGCDDATINAVDGSDITSTISTVASGGVYTFAKISINDQSDVTQGHGRIAKTIKVASDITSVTESGSQILITPDVITPSGILYKQIEHEAKVSYNTYDEGWWFINRKSDMLNPAVSNPATIQVLDGSATDPFATLKFDNIHGNKNRFTAQDGTQSFGTVIEDHLYYMEWINTFFSNATLATHLANAEADTTDGGATNKWRLASMRELVTILDMNSTAGYHSVFPFTASSTWTSSRYKPSSTNQIYNWGGPLFSRRVAGTTAYAGCYCRRGTW